MTTLFLAGRLVFGGFFALSGVRHFQSLPMLAQAAGGAGVPLPEVAVIVAGLLLLLGGLGVMLGAWPRVSLVLLLLFLLPAAFLMHRFWAIDDPAARALQLGNFLRNLALAGGALALMAVPLPWPASVHARRRRLAPVR